MKSEGGERGMEPTKKNRQIFGGERKDKSDALEEGNESMQT